MAELILSIIVILGLPGGPTGDFNELHSTDAPAVSQGLNPVEYNQ